MSGESGDLSSVSGDLVVEEEDLGWGDEGLSDDYTIDLGSMIVPQVGRGQETPREDEKFIKQSHPDRPFLSR